MDTLVGNTVCGFQLTRLLGSGSSGHTYEARDTAQAIVAVKLIHGRLSLVGPIDAFWEELQQLAQLSNPSIVNPTIGTWSKSGRFLLASQFVYGVNLNQCFKRRPKLPVAAAVPIAVEICRALSVAHAANITHGAIKPTNIIIEFSPKGHATEGRVLGVKLTDFCTRHLVITSRVPDAPIGHPGIPDPHYLSPEQFKGSPQPLSDVYAVGIVLYEALSGRRPYIGAHEELAQLHAMGAATMPDSIPASLAEILRKAIRPKAEQRFSSIDDLQNNLLQWLSAQGLSDRLDSISEESDENSTSATSTVRVAVEDLSKELSLSKAAGEEEALDFFGKELESVATTMANPVDEKTPSIPVPTLTNQEELDLAKLGERTSAALRPTGQAAAVARKKPDSQPSASDSNNDVELPIENSVKAFVAKISPTVPTQNEIDDSGRDSLEAALDRFILEAKAKSATLPPVQVDPNALAALARSGLPTTGTFSTSNETTQQLNLPETAPVPTLRKPVWPIVLGAFALGGIAAFGAFKLLSKPQEPAPVTHVQQPAEPAQPTAVQGGATTDTQQAKQPEEATATPPIEAKPAEGAVAPSTENTPPAAATTEAEKPATVVAPAAKKAKTGGKLRTKSKAKPAKRGSDWVDPFSQ